MALIRRRESHQGPHRGEDVVLALQGHPKEESRHSDTNYLMPALVASFRELISF